jgi:uncharacterized membrane protein YhiD involved in acid resistance
MSTGIKIGSIVISISIVSIVVLLIYLSILSNKLTKVESELNISKANNCSLKLQIKTQNDSVVHLIENIEKLKNKKSEINIARKEALNEISKIDSVELINVFNKRLQSISNKTYRS